MAQRVKGLLICLLGIGLLFASGPNLYADGTSDEILNLLIKKGIISKSEANKAKAEVEEEGRAEVPIWVKNMKLKGDLRLRNEYKADDPGRDNNRQRVRFRAGVATKINDEVKVGFGLSSGSSDTPTSTNQTLEGTFESKDIWLDYAYASYDPYDWLYFIGGKFKSPFFHTDMLWDSDVRFDGFAVKLNHKVNPKGNVPTSAYLTTGYFPIDDNNGTDGDDIGLWVVQLGSESKFNDGYAKLKTGLALFDFHNLKDADTGELTYGGTSGNTLNGTNLRYDYEVLVFDVKLSFKDLLGLVDVPFGVFSEYADNLEASKSNEAWRLGFWLGQSKVKDKGGWKFLFQYSRLGRDAFFDGFPDADFNNAGTNGKGLELIFDYALADNVILSFDYYNTKRISGSYADEQIIQTDLIFKF